MIANTEKAFDARNAVAHQRWLRNPKTGEVGFIKEKARVTYTMELFSVTVDHIKRDALILYEAGLSLFALLEETGLRPAFPSESRIRGQNSEAARRQRRKGLLDE